MGRIVTRKAVLLYCATPLALCLGAPAWAQDAAAPQATPTPAPDVPAANLQDRPTAPPPPADTTLPADQVQFTVGIGVQ